MLFFVLICHSCCCDCVCVCVCVSLQSAPLLFASSPLLPLPGSPSYLTPSPPSTVFPPVLPPDHLGVFTSLGFITHF